MPMFDEDTKKQLSKILEEMINPVKIIFFSGENEKSKETQTFVQEFSEFSDKLTLIIYQFNSDKAKEWNTFATPAIWVTTEDESLKGVGFYGTPGGYEINSFLMSILEVSGKREALSSEHQSIINKINTPTSIYVYISLTCPQCPQAVMNGHRLAIENKNIRTCMVEGAAFKEFTEKFGVSAFPTIIIDDKKLIGENAKDLNKLVNLLK